MIRLGHIDALRAVAGRRRLLTENGEILDEAGIQFRTLNASKGAAVRATRAQADRALYRHAIRRRLENAKFSLRGGYVDELNAKLEELGSRRSNTG